MADEPGSEPTTTTEPTSDPKPADAPKEPFKSLSFETEEDYRSFIKLKARPLVDRAVRDATTKPSKKKDDPDDTEDAEAAALKADLAAIKARAQIDRQLYPMLAEAGCKDFEVALEKIQTTEDADASDLKAAVAALQESKPYLFGGDKRTTTTAPKGGGNPAPEPLDDGDFTPEGLARKAEAMGGRGSAQWRKYVTENASKIPGMNAPEVRHLLGKGG